MATSRAIFTYSTTLESSFTCFSKELIFCFDFLILADCSFIFSEMAVTLLRLYKIKIKKKEIVKYQKCKETKTEVKMLT